MWLNLKRLGIQTLKFDNPVTILETASIVGPKEAEGPMADYFDKCLEDEFWQEKTWEKAESKIIKETVLMNLMKSGLSSTDINYSFSGDLLNQCISSSFGLRELRNPPIWNIWGMFNICWRNATCINFYRRWSCRQVHSICFKPLL